MSRVGRQIAWEERKKSQVTLDRREVSGIIMDVADTTSVMDRVKLPGQLPETPFKRIMCGLFITTIPSGSS